MNADQVLRDQLLALLRGSQAYSPFDQIVADFPLEHINTRPPNVPYTPWHLLEHLRFAQRDMLNYIRDPHYTAPEWPDDYWPPKNAQADARQWNQTINDFRADLQALQTIVADPQTDLIAPLPHAPQYNILREILVVADHNAYHIGEFAILRQVMCTWPLQA